MDDKVDAIIRVTVPKWQIGEKVSIYFPDTMTALGKCETLDESFIQEVLNKRCMTAVTNEYLIALYGKGRSRGEWIKEYRDFKCSLCGKIAYSWNDRGTYIQIKSDFCPHCGARMVKAE